jgi:16S rRNA processing protein RimM
MVRVGQVRGAFGVAGAVKVEPLTDHDDRLAAGAQVWVAGERHDVEWARVRPQGLVLKLSGVDDRTRAGLQVGRYLEVPLAEVKPLPAGSWYHHQLLGLRVRSESGRELGEIVDVLERPANDVWIARAGRAELLVPATKDAVLSVDLDAGHVVVADWLLEEDDA